jgi:hypothetical protein
MDVFNCRINNFNVGYRALRAGETYHGVIRTEEIIQSFQYMGILIAVLKKIAGEALSGYPGKNSVTPYGVPSRGLRWRSLLPGNLSLQVQ